jgi:hypothetical protein
MVTRWAWRRRPWPARHSLNALSQALVAHESLDEGEIRRVTDLPGSPDLGHPPEVPRPRSGYADGVAAGLTAHPFLSRASERGRGAHPSRRPEERLP